MTWTNILRRVFFGKLINFSIFFNDYLDLWARFYKVPIINGLAKLLLITCKVEFSSWPSNLLKLSVNETKWSSLLARTHDFILYISIWIFDFDPEKLPVLSRNWPMNMLSRGDYVKINVRPFWDYMRVSKQRNNT